MSFVERRIKAWKKRMYCFGFIFGLALTVLPLKAMKEFGEEYFDVWLKKQQSVHVADQSFDLPFPLQAESVLPAPLRSEGGDSQESWGKKPFSCPTCPKTFARAACVRRHVRTHTGEKPFQCTLCQKNFSDYGNRVRHQLVHTNKRPFACELCGAEFKHGQSAKVHRGRCEKRRE
jgi:hypothetical protein